MKTPIRVIEGRAQPYEPFWSVRADASGAEIDFFGPVSEYSWLGDEVTPKKFKDDLYSAGKGGPVTVRIHSAGGEIFAASAIRAMLMEYPGDVTVKVIGLCASAAVAIALAGKRIQIADTAYMMIHNPGYSGLWGYLDAKSLEKLSAELRVFREGLVNAYEQRTGLARDRIEAMMDAETWMSASDAVSLGFADELITGIRVPVEKSALMNFMNVPQALMGEGTSPLQDQHMAVQIPEPLDIMQEQGQKELIEAAQARRSKLDAAGSELEIKGETIMNERELLKKRAELLARAEALLAKADEEQSDLTDDERAEFTTAIRESSAIAEKVKTIRAERESLREAVLMFSTQPAAEKPEAAQAKFLSRAEFEKLSPPARAEFLRRGGSLSD